MSRWFLILLAFPAFTLPGCGADDGLPRVAVTGSVMMNSEGLPAGGISFVPAEGHSGPAANGAVEEGYFAFSSSDGPVPGPHVCTITFTPTKDELIRLRADGKEIKTSWEFPVTIPEKSSFERHFTLAPPEITEAESNVEGDGADGE